MYTSINNSADIESSSDSSDNDSVNTSISSADCSFPQIISSSHLSSDSSIVLSSPKSSFFYNIKNLSYNLLSPRPTAPYRSQHSYVRENIDLLKYSSSRSTLACIISSLSDTMKHSVDDSNCATMLPSLINSLPSGKEHGTFLSVDVGGSTLRVALIELRDRSAHIISSSTTPINASIKSLPGLDFFLWIGQHIKSLLVKNNYMHHLSMGLSWSFPIAQLESVDRGTILTMGKGYFVADKIAGWDLNDAFSACFEQLGLDINLTAIVNDTIASIISHSYVNPSTRAAIILGTGVNSSMVLDNALINTEMSLMGGDMLPSTKWDTYLDEHVERPGFQPFETKVSGRYLGEVARLVIADLVANCMLVMRMPVKWKKQYGLETRFMSELEGLCQSGNLDEAHVLFKNETGQAVSTRDLELIHSVLVAVSTRSAAWIAASIVSLALNMDTALTVGQQVTIAYSGTVIEKYSNFKERCQEFMEQEGFERGLNLRLESALDGTLYGPAIASAMYEH